MISRVDRLTAPQLQIPWRILMSKPGVSAKRNAIATLNPDEMLAKIAEQLEIGLTYDHIGIALLDYSTREVVVQAEAGKRRNALGRRIPLGVGLLGHVARSGQMATFRWLNPGDSALRPILEDSLAAIALPIFYAEQLHGALYVESSGPLVSAGGFGR